MSVMESETKLVNVAVFSDTDGFCVGEENGDDLYWSIKSGLGAGLLIDLNFSGVTHLTTHFLDASIGRLYGEYLESCVSNWLRFSNIEPGDLELVHRVIKCANHYYSYPRRWHSPDKLIEDSESLAVGCRALAGYTDGKKLFGIPASACPDYLCGWRLSRKRTDRFLKVLETNFWDCQSDLFYRMLTNPPARVQLPRIKFERTARSFDQEMASFYSLVSATICNVFGLNPEELGEELNSGRAVCSPDSETDRASRQ